MYLSRQILPIMFGIVCFTALNLVAPHYFHKLFFYSERLLILFMIWLVGLIIAATFAICYYTQLFHQKKFWCQIKEKFQFYNHNSLYNIRFKNVSCPIPSCTFPQSLTTPFLTLILNT